MARIASTTSAGVPVSDPTGGMTIDALMARQKMLAEQAGQIAAPRQMISPWQGAAQLAQTFVNNRKEHATEDQLKAGRAALAQIMSGIDPASGATSAQTGEAYQIDPDLGLKPFRRAARPPRSSFTRASARKTGNGPSRTPPQPPSAPRMPAKSRKLSRAARPTRRRRFRPRNSSGRRISPRRRPRPAGRITAPSSRATPPRRSASTQPRAIRRTAPPDSMTRLAPAAA
jgi:hypothetical protein